MKKIRLIAPLIMTLPLSSCIDWIMWIKTNFSALMATGSSSSTHQSMSHTDANGEMVGIFPAINKEVADYRYTIDIVIESGSLAVEINGGGPITYTADTELDGEFDRTSENNMHFIFTNHTGSLLISWEEII